MVNELPFPKQSAINVTEKVYYCLRGNLSHKGSLACQLFDKKQRQDCGLVPFECRAEGLNRKMKHKVSKFLRLEDQIIALQKLADSIIMDCAAFVTEKLGRKSNYHDTYIEEILHMIDERLQNNPDAKGEIEFEVSLKQHIFGVAARQFQKMHEDFIHENDPYRCLNENKEKFGADFKDVFHERDQRQKKEE